MNLAITGANGFIGSHVLKELEKKSILAKIAIRPNTKKNNMLSNYSVIQFDLHKPPANVYEILGSPDVLIHLAWDGLPNYKSDHHIESELPLQFSFIKTLIQSGLKNIIVTGTCFEYGMQSGALHEEMITLPNNSYGIAKDLLRKQLENLKNEYSFKLTWARLFYLYGDGQSEMSLYSQLKKAIEQKEQTFNMSGGEQLRDYLPVTELAKYLVTLALMNRENGIVNICSGIPISIRNLVLKWLEENKWSINPNFGYYPYPDYEPMAFWGNNKKLKQILQIQ